MEAFLYDIEQNQTEVVDEVEFELPYGLVGKMLEGFATNQLRKIFDHRRRPHYKTVYEHVELFVRSKYDISSNV